MSFQRGPQNYNNSAPETKRGVMERLRLSLPGGRKAGNTPPTGQDDSADGRIFQQRLKRPNVLLTISFTTLQLIVFAVLLLSVGGLGAVIGIAKGYMDTTPTLDVDKLASQQLTSYIYDANGDLITTFVGMENREWASIDEIPEDLQNAVVATEDSRFYQHNGVDLKRIVGAFFSNMNSESTQGGSTLTQQLIKMRLLTSERNYKRKIQEAWLAMQLENKYTKTQILEAYLNAIPLGQSNYGVKAAAKDYFGKDLDELTLRECAMLGGLTQSPYLYDPRRNTYVRNRMDLTDKRTNTVLMLMYQQGYIDKTQYQMALTETVSIREKSATTQMYDMPYFVEYAIEDIITHILKDRNLENTKENRSKIDDELRTSGYRIYLTVDPEIQKTVEDTVFNWTRFPSMRYSTEKYTTSTEADGTKTKLIQPQCAAVVIDYRKGEYKAIVGGRQQPTAKRTLNRAYMSRLGVGSSIKPIAVYGPAIDKGAGEATVVLNVPAKITGWGGKGYPNNYGGGGFSGPVPIRTALIKSLNVVAARLLMEYVTIDDSMEYLAKNGVVDGVSASLNKDGPGLSLGTSGLPMTTMAAAFGTFGNKGTYIEPLTFTKIIDSQGATVMDANKIRVKTQVFKPSTAWIMVDMLTAAVNGGTGTGARISGMTVAGKTGTNSDYRGVSFVGFTPYYSAGVYVGHDNYKQLSTTTGGGAAAPIFKAFMTKIHEGLKDKKIIKDSPSSLGLVKATLCGVSGFRTTSACALDPNYKPTSGWFLKGTVPTESCNMHYENKMCTVSQKLATEFCPAEDVEASAILVIPKDSAIRSMSEANIKKYFPLAVLDFPSVSNLSDLNPDNPEYAELFCPVHTAQWAEVKAKWDILVDQCNSLNAQVKTMIANNPSMPSAVVNSLNNKVSAIKVLIKAGIEDPMVPAQTAYDNLLAAYQDLYSYAQAVKPTPTPATPTPTPTSSPGTSPTGGG